MNHVYGVPSKDAQVVFHVGGQEFWSPSCAAACPYVTNVPGGDEEEPRLDFLSHSGWANGPAESFLAPLSVQGISSCMFAQIV